ncbi:chemotaxis-specific protein-glutamate methyltransferase CheB [Schlesneria sp.]|uniref:chemotaxis-specific protein-glutamate methyltransferase CheB n=1 Tax=Schlesneria sp. TaxID=2762018 RepID=UPI002F023FEA
MTDEPLKILIVDDSRIFRSVIEEALSGRDDVRVVGSVWNGEKAVEFARASLPDFVTLDIEMPGMGGIATLRALRELAQNRERTIGILLVSLHTKRDAAITVEGLEEGAFDFISKPTGPDTLANAASLKEQLLEKIKAFRSRRKVSPALKALRDKKPATQKNESRFRAIVIGSSTGGPEAIARLLPVLTPGCRVPIFLVQHLPENFTHYFATSLARRCGTEIVEATEGTIPRPGVVYVAQGGKHLILTRQDQRVVMSFCDSPPENGCRPSVDVLFRSAAAVYGGSVLAVILTGMGTDGALGAITLKRMGAHVIVQDEESSIVWGMPGSVVAANAADEVLPIEDIGPALRAHLGIEG